MSKWRRQVARWHCRNRNLQHELLDLLDLYPKSLQPMQTKASRRKWVFEDVWWWRSCGSNRPWWKYVVDVQQIMEAFHTGWLFWFWKNGAFGKLRNERLALSEISISKMVYCCEWCTVDWFRNSENTTPGGIKIPVSILCEKRTPWNRHRIFEASAVSGA